MKLTIHTQFGVFETKSKPWTPEQHQEAIESMKQIVGMFVRGLFRADKIESSTGERPSGQKDEHGNDVMEPCTIKTVNLWPIDLPPMSNEFRAEGYLELKIVTDDKAMPILELGKRYNIDVKLRGLSIDSLP